MDTIFALASARGKAGVSIIRLSGPEAHAVVERFCGGLPEMRRASLRRIVVDGQVLDEALIIAFAAGQSFTGEPSAEFQVHGSIAVVAALLAALGRQPGLRPAAAGEFTRRALENNRLDLSQVEGLADLVEAETEAQRAQALQVFSGSIRQKTEVWRRDMIRAAALLEATIDFADEDVPIDVTPEVAGLLNGLISSMSQELAGIGARERLREGFEVAIIGAPNVGKSTLLNRLAQREAAITSDIAGTTRDVIEVRMDIAGLPVTLLDTAGLRDTTDKVEAIGVARARERADRADLRVFLTSGGSVPAGVTVQADDIVLRGKSDVSGGVGMGVSGLTGAGVPELVAAIGDRLAGRLATGGVMSRERHRKALCLAIEALESARSEVSGGMPRPELAAAELRRAAIAVSGLIGHVGVEALLDEIFASFCIGK
jgi:tRNA modification GTPase